MNVGECTVKRGAGEGSLGGVASSASHFAVHSPTFTLPSPHFPVCQKVTRKVKL
ncbi:MAG: hypothetical protein LBQ39_06095 [Tannerellaceae bacterium]|nr:hypothetical protein [Tannerellaceae bacterium]